MGCALRSFIFPALAAVVQAQTGAGTVMGITGRWSLGGQELRFGSSVARDAALSCDPGSTLQVAAADSDPPVRLFARCDSSKTFALKNAQQQAEPAGIFKRLQSAIAPYGRRQPEGLIAAVSRDFGREVRESVVALRDGKVDLAPGFRDALPGAYRLRLDALGGPPAAPIAAQWAPGKPLAVPANTLKPGIYQLTVLDSAGEADSQAWILICAPGDYAAASEAFAQVLDIESQGPGDLDPAAQRPSLRAFLQSLAASPKGR